MKYMLIVPSHMIINFFYIFCVWRRVWRLLCLLCKITTGLKTLRTPEKDTTINRHLAVEVTVNQGTPLHFIAPYCTPWISLHHIVLITVYTDNPIDIVGKTLKTVSRCYEYNRILQIIMSTAFIFVCQTFFVICLLYDVNIFKSTLKLHYQNMS